VEEEMRERERERLANVDYYRREMDVKRRGMWNA
jgi:hypothetical protein